MLSKIECLQAGVRQSLGMWENNIKISVMIIETEEKLNFTNT